MCKRARAMAPTVHKKANIYVKTELAKPILTTPILQAPSAIKYYSVNPNQKITTRSIVIMQPKEEL